MHSGGHDAGGERRLAVNKIPLLDGFVNNIYCSVLRRKYGSGASRTPPRRLLPRHHILSKSICCRLYESMQLEILSKRGLSLLMLLGAILQGAIKGLGPQKPAAVIRANR